MLTCPIIQQVQLYRYDVIFRIKLETSIFIFKFWNKSVQRMYQREENDNNKLGVSLSSIHPLMLVYSHNNHEYDTWLRLYADHIYNLQRD